MTDEKNQADGRNLMGHEVAAEANARTYSPYDYKLMSGKRLGEATQADLRAEMQMLRAELKKTAAAIKQLFPNKMLVRMKRRAKRENMPIEAWIVQCVGAALPAGQHRAKS